MKTVVAVLLVGVILVGGLAALGSFLTYFIIPILGVIGGLFVSLV